MIHNQRPYAVKIAIPTGSLDAALARLVFGDDYLWGEMYFSDGTYVRRIVLEDEARTADLRFYFDGKPCRHGHIAPRKLRRGRRQTECMECRRINRKRAAERRTKEAA